MIRFKERPRHPRGLLPTLCLIAAGCGDAVSDQPATVERDSAGVTIVENSREAAGRTADWTLGAAPAVEIGVLDGPEAYQLYQVGDGLRLRDGRLVIANGATGELRVYDAEGIYLETWGRQGEGPGEFLRPSMLTRWPGDSLAVWDSRQRRLSILSVDGRLGRTLSPPPAGDAGRPAVVGVLSNGRLVVSSPDFRDPPDGSAPVSGKIRVPVEVAITDPTGGLVASLGPHPGDEAYMRIGENSIDIMRGPSMRQWKIDTANDALIMAGTEALAFDVYDAEGTLVRRVGVDHTPRRLTDEERSAELERRVDAAPEEARAGIRRAAEEMPAPDTLPAFSALETDASGAIWVRPTRWSTDEGPERWLVVDGRGQALGRVELPAGLDVFDVGEDYVLGRATDELGVEKVQLWPLTRN